MELAQLFEASLDPSKNKEAEAAIRERSQQPGFSFSLLSIVASEATPQTIRLAAAVYFKNFITRNWTDVEANYKLPQNEVDTIKRELVGLMTTVPPNIQAQLGAAISSIAESDFYVKWDTLVKDLVLRLTPDNAAVNSGVLQVAHSIFRRWRPLQRSDDLFTEINHVLAQFSTPFLQLLINTDQAISQKSDNKAVLQLHLKTLDLIMKLFYDLSCQDLPPVFEENLRDISGLLHKYLVYDEPSLHTDDDAEAGILEEIKTDIFEALILYTQKYEDEFEPLLSDFVSSSWNLVTNIGTETKYDILVSKALQFLTSATRRPEHAQAFSDQGTLSRVVEGVILPNVTLRDSDMELFEDEPIEFIRRDLEGSDSDTRRRAATDFLRQLLEKFVDVTAVVSQYINVYLRQYAEDRQANWKAKDTAVYLFSAIAIKGATQSEGVKSVNVYVDFLEFFQNNIAEDIVSDSVAPILRVDAIKFMYNFRGRLSNSHWHNAFPLLVKHLGSPEYVVHTYASIAVERALTLTGEDKQPMIPRSDVVTLSKDLLQHLFSLIQKDSAPQKIQENEFLMRCVMRVLLVVKEDVLPILDMILTNFVNITRVIRHNPSNPRFYHYLFEGIGALIRYAAPVKPEKMETTLYEPFAACLQEDVQEFSPYIFQLFAALLEANPSGTLSQYYLGLIAPILMPTLWESKGNVPALVRLLASIVPRGAQSIVQNNQVEPILGIYQKLLSTRTNERHAFDLIETIVSALPVEALSSYWTTILQLQLTRLSNNKTEALTNRFIRFFHFISAQDGLGADFFIKIADEIQHDVFKPVYLTVILPDTQKLARPLDRKIAVISFTKTLTDSQAFVERYPKGWTFTCEALLKLLINPPVPPTSSDDIAAPDAADIDELSFGVGFTELRTCRRQPRDPFPEVTDVKLWVGQFLRQGDARTSGRVGRLVQERLGSEARTALDAVMSG